MTSFNLVSEATATSSVHLALEQVKSVEIALDVEAWHCHAQQGTPQIWHVMGHSKLGMPILAAHNAEYSRWALPQK